MFTRAIVRIPGENLSEGLTSVGQGQAGPPVYDRALQQHAAYRKALEACGLQVTVLGKDLEHPDSTFVEDTAVLTRDAAIFTRPGADSRKGEVERIHAPVLGWFRKHYEITAPGTLEGGDLCQAGNHFFIGLSRRTNEEGARQLAGFLAQEGYTCSCVDIRRMTSILHLKSGIACIGGHTLVLMDELADRPEFQGDPDHPGCGGRELRRQLRAGQRPGPAGQRVSGAGSQPQGRWLCASRPGHVRIPQDGRRPELPVPAFLTPPPHSFPADDPAVRAAGARTG